MANEVTKPNQTQVALRDVLERAKDKLAEVAPKHLKADRVIRIMLAAASRDPKIAKCSTASILNFCMKCSETGLEPIGAGGAWPIPHENRKNGTFELTFIPDYRGLMNSAKRAGCIVDAYAEVVYENDEFDYELGLEPTLTHKPARGDRGQLYSAYCVFVLPSGIKRFTVMDSKEINGIRARSKGAESKFGSPWQTDEGEMWKKTVVRRAMKPFYGNSPMLDAALDADNSTSGVVVHSEPVKRPRAIQSAPAIETVVSEADIVPDDEGPFEMMTDEGLEEVEP